MKLFGKIITFIFIALCVFMTGCGKKDNETNDEPVIYIVTFVDYDGKIIKEEKVNENESAVAPSHPTREGFEFIGWDKTFNYVTQDMVITAQYKEIIEGIVNEGLIYEKIDLFTCAVVGIQDSSVKEINIPEFYKSRTVVELRDLSFCAKVEKIKIPSTVQKIEIAGIPFCETLIEIEVDENNANYKSIDGNLYTKDGKTIVRHAPGKKETSFVIPDYVTSIESCAFGNCNNLESIVISKTVTKIGSFAFPFDNFNRLVDNVYYNGTLEDWCNIEFSYEYSNPGHCAEKIHMKNNNNEYYEVKELVIPNTITSIGNYQFSGFTNLERIIIPDSVTSIGDYAFAYSTAYILETPNTIVQWGKSTFFYTFIPDVYYNGTIEDWCKNSFNDSSSSPIGNHHIYGNYIRNIYMKDSKNEYYEVTEIEIPNTITKIGDYQFSGFENITDVTIPNCVTSIGEDAFYECSSLESITVPDGITSIGYGAFSYCSSLENVYYKGTLEDWCSIKFNGSFSNPMYYAEHFYMKDSNNEYYEVTEIEIHNTVTSIGSYQFYSCDNITSIVIPSSVTSIGTNAFYYCSSLENVYYNGTIEEWCQIEFSDSFSNPMYYAEHFYMKDSNNEYYEVTEIEIHNTVTSIGSYQFSGFNYITKVIIPASVINIGSNAFHWCSSLTNIEIPNSVTSIDEYAFNGCSSLENVYYAGTIEDWCNIRFGNVHSNPMNSAEHFYMKDSNNEYYEVTELVIPNTLTSIEYQFAGFDKIKKVVIPNSVTSIGEDAFRACGNINNVYYNGTLEDWCNIEFGSEFSNPFYNGHRTKHFYMKDTNNEYYDISTMTEFTIPNTMKTINYQFCGLYNLRYIYIPSTVSTILEYAFYCINNIVIYCEATSQPSGWDSNWNYSNRPVYWGINETNFYEENGIQYILNTETKEAIISKYIGTNTDVTIKTKIKINDDLFKLITIGESAFTSSLGFSNVYFEGTIEDWCNLEMLSTPMSSGRNFYMKDSNNEYYEVTKIEIPNTVTYIGPNKFSGFNNLEEIVISNNVISIDSYAFENCTKLTKIIIPSTVVKMGTNVFRNCRNITIYCEAESQPEGWENNWNNMNYPVIWGYTE